MFCIRGGQKKKKKCDMAKRRRGFRSQDPSPMLLSPGDLLLLLCNMCWPHNICCGRPGSPLDMQECTPTTILCHTRTHTHTHTHIICIRVLATLISKKKDGQAADAGLAGASRYYRVPPLWPRVRVVWVLSPWDNFPEFETPMPLDLVPDVLDKCQPDPALANSVEVGPLRLTANTWVSCARRRERSPSTWLRSIFRRGWEDGAQKGA